MTPRRTIEAELFAPPFFPAADSVVATYDGITAVQRQLAGKDFATWQVFDARGSLSGEFKLTSRSKLLQIKGAKAWVLEFTDLDVPQVVRYRIKR